jgi:hypothetical protein
MVGASGAVTGASGAAGADTFSSDVPVSILSFFNNLESEYVQRPHAKMRKTTKMIILSVVKNFETPRDKLFNICLYINGG